MKVRGVALLVMVFFLTIWGTPIWAAEDANALFEQGKELLKEGNYSKALEAFSRVIGLVKSDGTNATIVRLARAQAYYRSGELRKSWDDVNAVLKSSAADGETVASGLRLRGALHLRRNRTREALEDFTDAIKTSHENPKLRSLSFADRGMAFLAAEKLDKAVSDFTMAISLDPESSYAYAGRGLARLRQDRIDLAKKDSHHAATLGLDDQTKKIVETVTKELSVSASGPSSVEVPLGENGHVFVQMRFSKKGRPRRFMLDTGATHTLVDRALLEEISKESEVKKIGKASVRIADGTEVPVGRYMVKTAFLYNLPLGSIEVLVLDRKKGRAMNLLGVRSLRNIIVSIDNAGGKARISRQTAMGE